ncbi:hypothetical protein [Frankia sp. CiP1_Cm_nod1]|uniref:hypothetical protein n=1 Tax=Frankia sp. CiP1_Cm_nod1 TaxID=2897160 RepID=UPI002024B606
MTDHVLLERAADCYLRAGHTVEAARCYRDAGSFQRAAELSIRTGRYRDAAADYTAAGLVHVAAWLLVHNLDDPAAARASLSADPDPGLSGIFGLSGSYGPAGPAARAADATAEPAEMTAGPAAAGRTAGSVVTAADVPAGSARPVAAPAGSVVGTAEMVAGSAGSVVGTAEMVAGPAGSVVGAVGSVAGSAGSVVGADGIVVDSAWSVPSAVGTAIGLAGSVVGAVGMVPGAVGRMGEPAVASVFDVLSRRLVLARCDVADGLPARRVLPVLADVQAVLAEPPVAEPLWPVAAAGLRVEQWAVALAEAAHRYDQVALVFAAAVRGRRAGAEQRWAEWSLRVLRTELVLPPAVPAATPPATTAPAAAGPALARAAAGPSGGRVPFAPGGPSVPAGPSVAPPGPRPALPRG